MKGVTLLIFSKDDVEQTLGLVQRMYDFVDEIVLMDASGRKWNKWIREQKKKYKFEKFRIYDVVALGYREPLMMYALTKCKNDWILDLDSDMLPSEQLRLDLHKLTTTKSNDAYSIALFTQQNKRKRTFVSYQARLFNKRKMEFRGVLHEKPIVHGKLGRLDQKYYVDHVIIGMVHSTGGSYGKMERFKRFTYAHYNAIVLEGVDRAQRKIEINARNLSFGKRLLKGALNFYQFLGRKSGEQEVSNLDYFTLRLIGDMAWQVRRRSVVGVVRTLPSSWEYVKEMKTWRGGTYGDEDFAIGQKIEKEGVTGYLELDKPAVVEALNKKYGNKNQGIDLLIDLLKEKYRKSHS